MGTMDGGSNAASQTGYRFRNDDGDNTLSTGTGASYMAALNTAIDVPEDDETLIRLRIAFATSAETVYFQIERKIDAGFWFPVNTTDTAVQIGDTSYYSVGHNPENVGEELSSEDYVGDGANGCLLDDPYW